MQPLKMYSPAKLKLGNYPTLEIVLPMAFLCVTELAILACKLTVPQFTLLVRTLLVSLPKWRMYFTYT